MSVYKRGKKWGVDISYPDGRRIKKMIGNKKEAEAVETQLKKEILEQTWQVRFTKEIRFNNFIKKYLKYTEQQQAKSTYTVNKNRIANHIKPFFGKIPLSHITKEKIDAYRLHRQRSEAKANTIRNEFTVLSHMFKMATRWGYLLINPVQGTERPKIPKQPPKFLTDEETDRLLANCADHLYPIVLCALNTGMRKSELLNLKWKDIALDRREIVIKSQEDKHTKNYDFRHIGINDKLLWCLIWMNQKTEYVFTYYGQRILDIKRTITTAYKDAGINHHGQPLHILRHTFATNLIKQGTELEKIQQLLGHKDFSTTLQYAHLTSRSVKDEVNKL